MCVTNQLAALCAARVANARDRLVSCTLTMLSARNVMRCTMYTHEHSCPARALHAAKPPLPNAPGVLYNGAGGAKDVTIG